MDDISNLQVGDKVLVELEVENIDYSDDRLPILLYRPDHKVNMWVGKETIKEVKPRIYNVGDIVKVTRDGFSDKAMVIKDTKSDSIYLLFLNHNYESQKISKKDYTLEFIKENKIDWE